MQKRKIISKEVLVLRSREKNSYKKSIIFYAKKFCCSGNFSVSKNSYGRTGIVFWEKK